MSIKMADNANICPISTHTLNDIRFANSPSGDNQNSCTFVASQNPWNKPNISVANLVSGWNQNRLL